MLSWKFIWTVVIPLLGLELYLLVGQIAQLGRHATLFAEDGPVELGTAIFFVIAGCLAIRIARSGQGTVPTVYRLFFVLYALASFFVALEEISYGQHIFGLSTPEYFALHSTKNEINLHNLYQNRGSNVLHHLANIIFPFCAILLPLGAHLKHRPYSPDSKSFYLLPRFELTATVLVAQGVTAIAHVSRALIGKSVLVRPGEIQELYWAYAAMLYAAIIYLRAKSTSKASAFPGHSSEAALALPVVT